MEAVLIILLAQAVLGAYDTLYHHELQVRLPAKASARRELRLHAVREGLYGVVFLALAWTVPTGLWAWALIAVLAVEMVLTLADFLEEDRTRQLPPAERVLHTVLAVGYGIFLAALAPHLGAWIAQPTGLGWTGYGLYSVALSVFALGVFVWAGRDAVAGLRKAGAGASAAEAQGVANDCEPAGTTLVTGGTGFIGSALVRALAADGQRVIVLSRDLRQARAQFATVPGRRVTVVDRLDMLPEETRIDAVVDLAGAPVMGPPWTERRKRTLVRSRVGVTEQVLALMRRMERRPEVLVAASAVGFYGVAGDDPVDETAPSQQDFAARLCQAREAAAAEAETLGVRTVCLRFGIVLGRDGGVLPPMALASRMGVGAVLGSGRQAMPWVHIADAVGLIRFAIADAALSGPVNATAPETPTQAEFARTLAGACGRVAWMRVPAGLLRLGLGEQASLLLRGRPVLPARALASGYRFRFAALAPALQALCGAQGAMPAVSVVRGDDGERMTTG